MEVRRGAIKVRNFVAHHLIGVHRVGRVLMVFVVRRIRSAVVLRGVGQISRRAKLPTSIAARRWIAMEHLQRK